MNPDELLPIGTKVILNDPNFTNELTTITGLGTTDSLFPYYVRAKADTRYPASAAELTVVGPDESDDGGCEPPTKAEQLKALAKRLDAAWNEVSEVKEEAQRVIGYVRASGVISDALGRLAIAHRELAEEAGRAWVEEND